MRTDVGRVRHRVSNITFTPCKFFHGIIQWDSLDEYKKWKN